MSFDGTPLVGIVISGWDLFDGVSSYSSFCDGVSPIPKSGNASSLSLIISGCLRFVTGVSD